MKIYSLNEKMELINELHEINGKSWAEFLLHWNYSAWSHLFSTFVEYQVLLLDENNKLMAYGHTMPIYWDQKLIDIPDNLKTLIENGVESINKGIKPNILLALAAVVSPEYKNSGLSTEIVKAMKKLCL